MRLTRTTRTPRTPHTATIRTAVIAACAATALAVTGTLAAQAATPPGFLDGPELPPRSGAQWSAGEITPGTPDPLPFCVDAVLPDEGTYHRLFTTGLDTEAAQISVVAKDTATAERLARQLAESAANCAADWLRDNPGATASWRDYGTQDVGDGAHLYGVHTSPPESEHSIHLLGVGRDGRTVTVVQWGQMGTFEQAPVEDFTQTVRTAVNKLN